MYIHEYQAKTFLSRRGVPIPAGQVAASPETAGRAFDDLRARRAVVKAQVHAGGRGKAGGILPAGSRAEAQAAARKLIGSTLVTAQTGPRGRPVEKVLVEQALEIEREIYLGVALDRTRGCPVTLASVAGGVEVESAAHAGGALLREYGDLYTGLAPFQARKLAAGLDLPHETQKEFVRIALALGKTLVAFDASLIELNPLALCRDGRLLAADVKMSFDDNALGRHPDIAELRDPAQEDAREAEARRHDLSYVGLDGSVGCMVNGAGLAMATMDALLLHGGRPANFLDVGGDATVEKVVAAFELLCRDPNVKVILVNIFGGIVRCDLIAEGILEAARQVKPTVPLVTRLEGTRAAEGRKALAASVLKIVSAEGLDEAAAKAVELAAGVGQAPSPAGPSQPRAAAPHNENESQPGAAAPHGLR